jgi:hypothetical protein
MKFRLLYCLAFALCIFAGTTAKAQIPQLPDDYHSDSIDKVFNGTDTDIINNILSHPRYRYISWILGSGANVLFLNKTTGGTIGVGFPYTATDATTGVTSNYTFQSQNQTIYRTVNPYWNMFRLNIGWLRSFCNYDLSIGSPFLSFSIGYGYSWYLNGFGEHEKNMADRRFVLRASINVFVNDDISGVSLGNIDNKNRTIQVLGVTAKPTYTQDETDDDGNDYTETDSAHNLKIFYKQYEGALMPKISIGSNPYRHATLSKDGTYLQGRYTNWELSLGYNIPFSDEGEIILRQDSNPDNPIGTFQLNTHGLTYMYNGKPTIFAPFRFSGLYVSFALYFGRAKIY